MFRDLTWPQLIGAGTGAVGSGLLLFGVSDLISMPRAAPRDFSVPMVVVATSTLIIVLSMFLYRGREWARRVLVAVAIFAALACTVRAASFFFMSWSGPIDTRMALSVFIADLARLILYAVAPAALVFSLCHRDVVTAFTTARGLTKA